MMYKTNVNVTSLLANKVMKSTQIFHEDKLKCALGTHPDIQFKTLRDTLELFRSMNFTGAEKRFVGGGIMTLIVAMALQKQLKFEYGIDYYLTSKLIQDYVERFFGELRSMSNDRNPPALHRLYRVQRVVTHKLTDVHICRTLNFCAKNHETLFIFKLYQTCSSICI